MGTQNNGAEEISSITSRYRGCTQLAVIYSVRYEDLREEQGSNPKLMKEMCYLFWLSLCMLCACAAVHAS